MAFINAETLGQRALNAAFQIRELVRLTAHVSRHISYVLNPSVRRVLYKQLYFTGIQSLIPVSVIGAMVGVLIISQTTNMVGMEPVLIGKVLVYAVVRELGPLLAAFLVIARSSTAIAAELGSMKAHKEIDSLRLMGIGYVPYIVVPRVFGLAISVIVLTFYFQAMAIGGGLLISSAIVDVSFFSQIKAIFSVLDVLDIMISFLKSFVFGFIIAASACFNGLRVKASIIEVPQVTAAAVMQSLSLVIVADVVITLMVYSI